jgi:trimethylamine:corrinoid methyltransferase-like protein
MATTSKSLSTDKQNLFDKFHYCLKGGFAKKELCAIKDDALNLLADIGVRIDHEGILAFLDSLKGVTRSGNRVRLTRDLVEEWLLQIREENYCYSYNRLDNIWRLVPPYMAANYRNPETNEIKPATIADQRICVKLCDALGMYGPSPLHVQEGPDKIRQLQTFKLAVENSSELGGWGPAVNVEEIRFIIAMGKAAGRKPPYACMEVPISPLHLNSEQLRMIFEQRENEQLFGVVVGGGAVPMPGATAPLSFPACISQGLADAISAYIIGQLIDPRLPGYCSFGGFLINLRTMDTFHPYFPETLMYNGMIAQVAEHVFGRKPGHFFKPDFYDNPGKIYQMGFTAAVDIMRGARSIHLGAETGDVFSPLNAIICMDIVRHLRKFVEGMPLEHSSSLTRELIEPGLGSGMYTDQESTLNYRKLYVDPHLIFRHDDHASLMAAAREEMIRLVDGHKFSLPETVQNEIDEIFLEAQKVLTHI